MGVPVGEEERENVTESFRGRSVPQTRVRVDTAFAIGAYSVTREQFAKFVEATGYDAGDRCFIYSHAGNGWDWHEAVGSGWRNPGFSQTDRDPVVCVSWDDAKPMSHGSPR